MTFEQSNSWLRTELADSREASAEMMVEMIRSLVAAAERRRALSESFAVYAEQPSTSRHKAHLARRVAELLEAEEDPPAG